MPGRPSHALFHFGQHFVDNFPAVARQPSNIAVNFFASLTKFEGYFLTIAVLLRGVMCSIYVLFFWRFPASF